MGVGIYYRRLRVKRTHLDVGLRSKFYEVIDGAFGGNAFPILMTPDDVPKLRALQESWTGGDTPFLDLAKLLDDEHDLLLEASF